VFLDGCLWLLREPPVHSPCSLASVCIPEYSCCTGAVLGIWHGDALDVYLSLGGSKSALQLASEQGGFSESSISEAAWGLKPEFQGS